MFGNCCTKRILVTGAEIREQFEDFGSIGKSDQNPTKIRHKTSNSGCEDYGTKTPIYIVS
jgi:hypothetical protein